MNNTYSSVKRIIAIAFAVLLIGASANALQVQFSMKSSSDGTYTSYSVEGQSFKLYGSESKTIVTSEGRYTFYGNKLYHKGTKEAAKHQSILIIEDPESGIPTYVNSLGPYECSYGMIGMNYSVKLADMVLRDYKSAEFAYVYPQKDKFAEISAKKSKNGFADLMPGTTVIVVENNEDYCLVETGELKGWVQTKNLEFFSPVDALKTMYFRSEGKIYLFDRSDSGVYRKVKAGTSISIIGKRGEYYEVICDGLRLFVQEQNLSDTKEE